MSEEHEFGEIGALFFELMDLDDADRETLLSERDVPPEIRAQVRALLDQHARDDDALERGLETKAVAGLIADSADEEPVEVSIPGYEITGVLGRGGMGVVYRARQQRPNREVALKVVRTTAFGDMLRRFEYEAEILGRLKHTGIAQIYEVGTFRDHDVELPYFAMELVEGELLSAWTRRDASTRDQKIELVASVCEAVEHAHQRNVVHRDLKPDNILVTAEGQPKILDFGIAKALGKDLSSRTILTGTGQIVGTLPYMSPEQVRGGSHDVDTRSDVYSLGVILYEALSGELPLDVRRLSLVEAVRIISDETPPSITRHDTSLRGDIEIVVSKALAKEPDRRYSSAGALAADLLRTLRSEPIEARATSALYAMRKFARRHRALVTSVATVFVVLVAALVVSLDQVRQTNRSKRELARERDESRWSAFLANVPGVTLTLAAGEFVRAREMLAAVPEDMRNWEWHHLSSRLERVMRVMGENVDWFSFAADGREIVATTASGDIEIYETSTGRRVWSFSSDTPHSQPVVTTDGATVVALEESDRVVIIDRATRTVRHRTAAFDTMIVKLQLEPDESRVVTICRDGRIDCVSLADAECAARGWLFPHRPWYGENALGLDDVDGDGTEDYAIAAPLADAEVARAGIVTINSGATGQELLRLQGPESGGLFGFALARAGDHDGDGIDDLLVGAPCVNGGYRDGGQIILHSPVTGRVLRRFTGIEKRGQLGWSVEVVGDIDGDGLGEILSTTARIPSHHTFLSSRDGSVIRTGLGGTRAVATDDADGDGVRDFAVVNTGVHVISLATGAVLWVAPCQARQGLGFAEPIGDADGDGVEDLVAQSEAGGSQARVLSGRDGAVLRRYTSLPDAPLALRTVPDRDGDGLREMLVSGGQVGERSTAGERTDRALKRAGIYSSRDGRLLVLLENALAGWNYLQRITAIGDVDGDGVDDVLAAAPSACRGRGWVAVHSGADGSLIRSHTLRPEDRPDRTRAGTRIPEAWIHETPMAIVRDPVTGAIACCDYYLTSARPHGNAPTKMLEHPRRSAPVTGLALDGARKRVISYDQSDRSFLIRSTETLQEIGRVPLPRPATGPPTVDRRGRLLTLLEDRLLIIDPETGARTNLPLPHRFEGSSPLPSPTSEIAAANHEGVIELIDTANPETCRVIRHSSFVYDGAFSPCGELVATAGWDNVIRVSDATTGKLLLETPSKWGKWKLAFSEDGERLMGWSTFPGRNDRTAAVVDLGAGTIAYEELSAECYEGKTSAFSGWATSGRPAARARAAALGVEDLYARDAVDVALAEDGSLFVPGDSLLRVLDGVGGRELHRLEGHESKLWCVAVSPDGPRLATGGVDGLLHIWDRAPGPVLARPAPHPPHLPPPPTGPPPQQIVTASGDGSARIWNSRPRSELIARARTAESRRARLAHVVTEALEASGDRAGAAAHMRARPELSPDERRDALHSLMRRFAPD